MNRIRYSFEFYAIAIVTVMTIIMIAMNKI